MYRIRTRNQSHCLLYRCTARADQIFRLTLADGSTPRLHVEFQGPGTRRPMPLRMLEYMTRMTVDDPGMVIYHVCCMWDGASGRAIQAHTTSPSPMDSTCSRGPTA